MSLSDQQIKDLVTGTLKKLGRLRFNQIAQRLQNYEVMGRIMKRDKVSIEDGIGIQRSIMIDQSSAAKHVGLHETDTVNIGDVLVTIDIPWRHLTSHYAYERRELLMNRGESRIVQLLKVRRIDAMLGLAELMEEAFWSLPDDDLKPFGVPYWIVSKTTGASAAASTGEFGGGAAAGFPSGPGNLSPTTYPRWKNWTHQYVEVSKFDLIPKMRKGYDMIRFKSPVDVPDFRRGAGNQYRIYTNYDVYQKFSDVGEGQNENLGRDIASMDGVTTFRRNPIIWVPYLDASAVDPVYMLNYAWFQPVFLKGDYLRETEPKESAMQHNTFVVFIDCTWNILLTNRREQAVFTL